MSADFANLYSPIMKQPDFFVVGAAKAGTTSLFTYLIQHPSIFVPPMKEPHFFSEYEHAGAPELRGVDDYLRLFDDCRPDQLAGDLSTSYLYARDAAQQIRELQPGAKIIMVLRNPIDRAYSFYWYNRNQFNETLGFEEALDAEPRRIAEGGAFRYHYTQSGMYHAQVERYLKAFGSESVRIYLFEDLVRDAAGLCDDILAFLGVPGGHAIRTEQVANRSGVHRSELMGRLLGLKFPGREWIRRLAPHRARRLKNRVLAYNMRKPEAMDAATRARLAETFRDDVERLSGLIGRDLSHWLQPRESRDRHPAAVAG
jgi:hypothetical protein